MQQRHVENSTSHEENEGAEAGKKCIGFRRMADLLSNETLEEFFVARGI